MYDSIRSGSISPLFSRTIGFWREKNGRPGSPRRAVTCRRSGPATIEAAWSGLTRS